MFIVVCNGQAAGLLLCVMDKQRFIVVCKGQATGLLFCVMDNQQVYCCV